jgi:hypothetical protein
MSPAAAPTLEGWLLGISRAESPVNQPLTLGLSEEAISAVAEAGIHNPDSPLFAIGFSSGPGVSQPYTQFGAQHGMGYFAVDDDVWQVFDAAEAQGDFWQINSQAIEEAVTQRRIFVLNVPYARVESATRSFSLPEIRLIEMGGYVGRNIGGHDILVPIELLDSYQSIIATVAPDLLAP